jgi:hypothetical protein
MSMQKLSARYDDGTTYVTQSLNGMRSVFSEVSVVSNNASGFIRMKKTKTWVCYFCFIS